MSPTTKEVRAPGRVQQPLRAPRRGRQCRCHQPHQSGGPELLEEWRRVLDTNLTGPFLEIQAALPLLRAGASVVIGSRAATVGIPLRVHDTAAKAGLIGLTRSLCKELSPRGIRVNLVAPGVIATEADSPRFWPATSR